jgi:hypothetical protein
MAESKVVVEIVPKLETTEGSCAAALPEEITVLVPMLRVLPLTERVVSPM